MWAALVGPIVELLKWLLGALVTEAKAPVAASITNPTADERARAAAALAAAESFPGIGK